MAGTDAEGYGGFKDKVNNHYLKTFGSAVMIALIGTGIDMSVPQSSTLASQDTASDAARRNFAKTFCRVADRTIQRSMDVQPTLEIRPGYKFNVRVDQDIVFPGGTGNCNSGHSLLLTFRNVLPLTLSRQLEPPQDCSRSSQYPIDILTIASLMGMRRMTNISIPRRVYIN